MVRAGVVEWQGRNLYGRPGASHSAGVRASPKRVGERAPHTQIGATFNTVHIPRILRGNFFWNGRALSPGHVMIVHMGEPCSGS
jgi:hypothetical protein